MASSEYEISLIEDKWIMERKLTITYGPNVVIGRKTFAPTLITAMWTRTRNTDWVLLSLAVEGSLVRRDEDGRREVHPDIVEKHRYDRVEWAPTWIQSAAKSHRPARNG